jgi:hypothetical protein
MCDAQELWRCNCIKHMGLHQHRFNLDVWCSKIVKMQPMATYYGIYRFYYKIIYTYVARIRICLPFQKKKFDHCKKSYPYKFCHWSSFIQPPKCKENCWNIYWPHKT